MINFKAALVEGAEKLDIVLDDKKIDKLFEYYNLVVNYNKMFNLTSIIDETAFAVKHVLDSISGAKFIPENAKVCDIGAGAGFPSIPLKIFRPDLDFILFDALNKRVNFLNKVVNELELHNISAVHLRAEDAGKNIKYRDSFDAVVTRAVGQTAVLLEYSIPLLKVNGTYVNYKGSDLSDVISAQNAAFLLNAKQIARFNFNLPFGFGERNLIVYKKTNSCLSKYPRPSGTIKNHPLE